MFTDAARTAMADDGAEAVVLGCAGLADLVGPLSRALGVPVVDGVAAAVGIATGLVAMGLNTSRASTFVAVELPCERAVPSRTRYDADAPAGMDRPIDVLVDGDRIGAIGQVASASARNRGSLDGGGRPVAARVRGLAWRNWYSVVLQSLRNSPNWIFRQIHRTVP